MSVRSRSLQRSALSKKKPRVPKRALEWAPQLDAHCYDWWAGDSEYPLRLPVSTGGEEAAETIWALTAALDECTRILLASRRKSSLMSSLHQASSTPDEESDDESHKSSRLAKMGKLISMLKRLRRKKKGDEDDGTDSMTTEYPDSLEGYLQEGGAWLAALKKYQMESQQKGVSAMLSTTKFTGNIEEWVQLQHNPSALKKKSMAGTFSLNTDITADSAEVTKLWKPQHLDTLFFDAPPRCSRVRPTLMVMRTSLPQPLKALHRIPRLSSRDMFVSRRDTMHSTASAGLNSVTDSVGDESIPSDTGSDTGSGEGRLDMRGCSVIKHIPWHLQPFILSTNALKETLNHLPEKDLQLVFHQGLWSLLEGFVVPVVAPAEKVEDEATLHRRSVTGFLVAVAASLARGREARLRRFLEPNVSGKRVECSMYPVFISLSPPSCFRDTCSFLPSLLSISLLHSP